MIVLFLIMCVPLGHEISKNQCPMPPRLLFPTFGFTIFFTKVVPVKETSPLSAETASKARSGRLSSAAGGNSAVVDGVRLDSDGSTDGGGNVSGARSAGDSSGSRVARAVVAAALRAGARAARSRAARSRVGARVGARAAGARVVSGLVSDGGSRARVARAGSNGDIDGGGGDGDSLLGNGDGNGGAGTRALAAVSRRSVGRRSIATSVGTRAATGGLNRLDCNVGRVSSGGRGGGGGFRAVLTVAESAGEGDGLLGSSLDGGGDDRGTGSLANGVSQGLVGDDIRDRNASVGRGSDSSRRSSLDGRAGDEAGGVSGLQRGRDARSLGHGADGGGQDNGIGDNHGGPGRLGQAASTGGVEASWAVGNGGSTADDGVNRGSNDGQRGGSSIVNGSGGGVGPGEVQVADGRGGRGQAGEEAKSSNGSGLHLDDSCDGVFFVFDNARREGESRFRVYIKKGFQRV